MALRLGDQWIWDFWLVQDGSDYHIFYLQAPRSLKQQRLRHWHVSVGHAVSQNLQDWEILPEALRPSQAAAWDNAAIWTGSMVSHAGTWYFFYTGAKQAEQGLVQRIGLATSANLLSWEKHPGSPLIEPDARWYELLDLDLWPDQAWRDPWVFQHPTDGDFHAFITARVNAGPLDERGVIAHARSTDLLRWEILRPVTEPGDFSVMEVPQMVPIQGRYYLLFSTGSSNHSTRRLRRTGLAPLTGTHYLVADDPLGPYHYATDNFLAGDAAGSLYTGKLIQGPAGNWCFLAFRNFKADGEFVGEIIDPLPVELDNAGNLIVVDG
jgi:beta-fructofuranosidase